MDIVQVAKEYVESKEKVVETQENLIDFFVEFRDVEEILVDVNGSVYKVAMVSCGAGLIPGGYGIGVSKIVVDPEVLKAKKK